MDGYTVHNITPLLILAQNHPVPVTFKAGTKVLFAT